MIRLSLCVAAVAAFLALTGCAHSVVVEPNKEKIVRDVNDPPRINTSVGFYVPQENIDREVITPGGGGDSVSYFPFRDIQSAYEQMLGNVFAKVVRLTSAEAKEQIEYVIEPSLLTTSGSNGSMTWPPTFFTIDLTSTIRDRSGKLVASPRVLGYGSATLGEYTPGTSLAGQRALEDAVMKMQKALFETDLSAPANRVANGR